MEDAPWAVGAREGGYPRGLEQTMDVVRAVTPKVGALSMLLSIAVGFGATVGRGQQPPIHPSGPVGDEVTAAAPHAHAGVVEGRVRLHRPPPRRTANRYPGAPQAVRAVQDLPTVVWVEGDFGTVPPPSLPVVMAQQDTAFVPGALTVPVGTTLRFPNRDPFFHNVFSYSATARFDLGRYPRGESKDVVLTQPGLVKIYCEVHDFMRSVVLVTSSPFHTVTDGEGRFRVEGLPPGGHTLVFWHADLGELRQVVQVPAEGTVRVDVELR